MKARSAKNSKQTNGATFKHAVVIGGSIAGLSTARVLADLFTQVTIVERDHLSATPEYRPGVPQAHHAHLLLPVGQALLEQQFPGLIAELIAAGATSIDKDQEEVETPDGAFYNDMTSLSCSRPLMEAAIYRRLIELPNVRMLHRHDSVRLSVDASGRRVTGVRVRNRQGPVPYETHLAADLVVDTSGRSSKAPQWLADLGYIPPRETTLDTFSGYASRIYRVPESFDGRWKMLRVKRIPPGQTRGGNIIPLEEGTWLVTIIGMNGDYPPHDEAGFLNFARSMVSPQFYEAIKDAEPLTKISGFRNTQDRLRHYDKLPRYLEGFVVSGDAACALSPVHAQGMTSAATGAQTLGRCLIEQRSRGSLTGLARTFQQQLRRDIDGIWRLVTDNDRLWPAAEVVEEAMPFKLRTTQPRLKSRRTTSSYGLTFA